MEEKQVVSSHVNSLLSKEVDRLSQYTRRSNLVLRNVFAPEKESVEQVEEKVKDVIGKMGLSDNVLNDFDKAHRLGKIKQINGKNVQDVIVRFKSHSSRYEVFRKRKAARNIKISPNLTKARGKLLHDAVALADTIEKNDWGFVFANMHGDILLRLKDKHKGKHYHPFDSMESLTSQLTEIGLL